MNDLYSLRARTRDPSHSKYSAVCANCEQLITGCSLHSVIVSCRPIAAAHSRGRSADGAVLAEPHAPCAQGHVRLFMQAPRHYGKPMAASAASRGSLHRADVRRETCSGSQGDVFIERGRGGECLMACLPLGFGEFPLRLLVERDVGGGEVLLQVRHRGGAGYQQDVGG